MKAEQIIEEFKSTWIYTRKMTDEFIKCVPEDKLNFSHHPKYGPLIKQFRHMVGVYSCYIDAFRTKKMDLSCKKADYPNLNTREKIQEALKKKDLEINEVLDSLKGEDLENYRINFFGQEMGFTEYSHVLVQHECAHFGIWANYAAFGEFDTPKMWQNDWEL